MPVVLVAMSAVGWVFAFVYFLHLTKSNVKSSPWLKAVVLATFLVSITIFTCGVTGLF